LAAIASTIILAVQDSEQLVRFYERTYTQDAERAEQYSRWRALGAIGKADHVVALSARGGLRPTSVLDVGCGDGALLSELRRRDFAARLAGAEIAPAAVAIARAHPGIDEVVRFDGASLPFGEREFDLGVLSHVLEHVRDPSALLHETARVCAAVVVEVPLEDNVSARRSSRRAHAEQVGHLQRLGRSQARAIVARAGLTRVAELEDPLPRAVHTFFASEGRARTAAGARWAVRASLHRLAPALARRTFTVHYACLALPRAS
jgi:SAM-dependent methyltransferase